MHKSRERYDYNADKIMSEQMQGNIPIENLNKIIIVQMNQQMGLYPMQVLGQQAYGLPSIQNRYTTENNSKRLGGEQNLSNVLPKTEMKFSNNARKQKKNGGK